jgi:UDP-N-acetylglucosamine--N-acetylmuramyl-(pentapeptide) pyrophosphoryl-undecaprenol N-acetylglucosamine transferase
MSEKSVIFIASGGTGGHIIPARCLALELSGQGFDVVFLGDKKYRSYIKESDHFSSKIINSSKLEKSIFKLLKAVLAISLGILQSSWLFLRHRPKYIIAFGGYATFPILVAAIIFRVKIILHEQNSHLGKVNRIFAKYADKIALSFKETSGIAADFFKKIIFVGNPVRQEILDLNQISYALPKYEDEKIVPTKPVNKMGYDVLLASDFFEDDEEENEEELFNVLIIGGSGGAKIFSEILPKAFFNLNDYIKEHLHITQQCRAELIEKTFEQYKSFNISITVDAFFEDMSELIKSAHLVISRSGSSSIFEFCAAKKPMILIPFAAAADNHQEKNARYLEKNGAAIVITENEFTINKINDVLKNLINHQEKLEKMSSNASNLATLNATKNLANLIK